MLAEAVARTDLAQRRSASLPSPSKTAPKGHPKPALNLARSLFPSEEGTRVANRPRNLFPWSRPDVSSPKRGPVSSGETAGSAEVSVQRLPSLVPTDSSPSSKSPQHRTQGSNRVHEDNEDAQSPVASEGRTTIQSSSGVHRPTLTELANQSNVSANRGRGQGQSTAVQRTRQKGG
jgi:hypothetical protein